MKSFKAFQVACSISAQKAQQKWQEKNGSGSSGGGSSDGGNGNGGGGGNGTPVALPAAKRRFPPKEGTLQTSGRLSRDFILKFCKKVEAFLLSKESIAQLSEVRRLSRSGDTPLWAIYAGCCPTRRSAPRHTHPHASLRIETRLCCAHSAPTCTRWGCSRCRGSARFWRTWASR